MTPEQALIRLYRQSATRLRAQIAADVAAERAGTAVFRARQLDQVNAELRALGQRSRPLAIRTVEQAYGQGLALGDAGAAHQRAAGIGPDRAVRFNGSHRRTMDVYARNLAGRLSEAEGFVGRKVEDAYRRLALEETAGGVARGATRAEVSAALERRLVQEKVTDALTGFVDKAGRRWQLDVYTEMVARTNTREAVTRATRNRLVERGQDLVTISDHGTDTELCQEYEGKTYSLTGATDGYEVLDQDPPFHPRCEHVMTAGTGDLDADLAVLEAELGAVG